MAVYGGPEIVQDNLALCLDATNAKSYPGTGSTWNNLVGTPTFSIGGATYSNNTLVYSGGNTVGGESVANSYPFAINTSYSINVTFKSTKLGDANSNCGDKRTSVWTRGGSSNVFREHRLTIFPAASNPDSSTGSLSYQVNTVADGSSTVSVGSTISVNQVYDIYCQYHSTAANQFYTTLYVNGNLVQTSATNSISYIPDGQLRVGGRTNNCTNGSLTGELYQFKLYNRTLSADEIKQNYAALRGRFGL
jgi:hypothetical protein